MDSELVKLIASWRRLIRSEEHIAISVNRPSIEYLAHMNGSTLFVTIANILFSFGSLLIASQQSNTMEPLPGLKRFDWRSTARMHRA